VKAVFPGTHFPINILAVMTWINWAVFAFLAGIATQVFGTVGMIIFVLFYIESKRASLETVVQSLKLSHNDDDRESFYAVIWSKEYYYRGFLYVVMFLTIYIFQQDAWVQYLFENLVPPDIWKAKDFLLDFMSQKAIFAVVLTDRVCQMLVTEHEWLAKLPENDAATQRCAIRALDQMFNESYSSSAVAAQVELVETEVIERRSSAVDESGGEAMQASEQT